MIKKFELQAVIEGLTQHMAEMLTDPESASELPMVTIRNMPVWCTEIRQAGLNEREIISIAALISWAAVNNNVPEKSVKALVADHFEKETVNDIEPEQYTNVIEYLVDFRTSIN